jgi:hypothetical protein
MHLDTNFWCPCNLLLCRSLLPRISILLVVVTAVTHLAKCSASRTYARPGRRRTAGEPKFRQLEPHSRLVGALGRSPWGRTTRRDVRARTP